MRAINNFALILCLLSPPALGESLLQVYEWAKKNDLQLKADFATYKAGIESVNIGRSALLPQINATANYTDSDTTGTGASAAASTDNLSYSLSLQQALFNSSALSDYRRSKTEASRAEIKLTADQQALMIRAAEAYFNALGALDQLRTSQTEERALRTQLQQTNQRYEVGLISINDVHQAQAAYDSAIANTLGAQAAVGIELESLSTITGQYPQTIAPLKDDFVASSPKPDTKKAWINFALKNNLSLKISKLDVDAAGFIAKSTRANAYPTLSGSLTYQHSEDPTGSDYNTNTNAVSLDLSMPIYTGGRLSAQSRQAAQNLINAEQTLSLIQRNTIQNTRTLFLSVMTDIAQIKARRQAIVSRNSALRATQAGYDTGTQDIVDLVNAQRNLFQTQRDYSTALYSYILNSLKLKEVAGLLSVKDLEQLDAWLQKSNPITTSITP